MSKQLFAKYEGAGNDFILFDDRALQFPLSSIRRLCDRKFGIGADGILLLQSDSVADFRMRIFNSDGSEAEGCGNGLRCLIQFIADLGFPKKPYRISIGNRIVDTEFVGERIAIRMGPALYMQHHQIGCWDVHFVDTGVPHAVIFVPDVSQIDLLKEAPLIRHHPLFQPRGANVNFASLMENAMRVRTFERGVEGETLACGTGAVAVTAIAANVHKMKSPLQLHFAGGELEVRFDQALTDLQLIGPARFIFRGLLDL